MYKSNDKKLSTGTAFVFFEKHTDSVYWPFAAIIRRICKTSTSLGEAYSKKFWYAEQK